MRSGASAPAQIYDELFLMTVSRHPTQAEIAKLEEVRAGRAVVDLGAPAPPKATTPGAKPAPKTPAPVVGGKALAPGALPDDVGFYQDVFWALLNSNEFMLNH
jgi:hypothetical protein